MSNADISRSLTLWSERRFVELVAVAERILASGADIDTIYEILFGSIYASIKSLPVAYQFEAPYGGNRYELAHAYVDSLKQKAAQLQIIIDAIDKE